MILMQDNKKYILFADIGKPSDIYKAEFKDIKYMANIVIYSELLGKFFAYRKFNDKWLGGI